MSRADRKSIIQLVGGLRLGTAPPGDRSFYSSLFARLPEEVSNTGGVTRYMGFDHLAEGEYRITFLGIEVDRIESIPNGMIAWDLDSAGLAVLEAKDGENAVIWQDDVVWQWRDDSPSPYNRGVTGEFSVRVPPEWSGTGTPELRSFSMTASAYVAPGRPGPDESVHLVDYDPSWPRKFKEFSDWLRGRLGPDVALKIMHIGSTAIPGMTAKPIIDVLVEVPSLYEAKQRALPALNRETWEYWWYDDHMVVVKRDRLMGPRTHHVHIVPRGRKVEERLAFRDHLRAHPEDAARYAALKRELAESHRRDREDYTEAKSAFVHEIVRKALENH